jgi:drug/metabolite transporter (DMT)-like permease
MFGKYSKGISFALLASFVSGISIFINKFAVTAIPQPLVFTSIKNTAVAISIIGVLFLNGKWRQIKKLSHKELGLLTLIGVVGGSIPFYLFFTGLSTIPAINGAIIQKTLVLWVAILAIPFLKEKLSRISIIAVFLLFLANILIGGFTGFKYSTGEGLVLLATLLWAIETVLAKKIIPNIDPDILTAARMGIGAIVLLLMSVIMQPIALSGIPSFSYTQWFWLALTATTLFIYVSTWYRALKFASAIMVTSILVGVTFVTNLLSAIFITHTFSSLLIIQSILITVGITILVRLESQHLVSPVA